MRLKCTIGSDTYSVFPASSIKNVTDSGTVRSFTQNGKTYYYAKFADTDDWCGNYCKVAGNASKAIFTYYVDGGKQYPSDTTFRIGQFNIRNFRAYATSSGNTVTGSAYFGDRSLDTFAANYLGAGSSSASDPYCIMIFSLTMDGIAGYMIAGGQSSWTYVDYTYPGYWCRWGFFWVSENVFEDGIQQPYNTGNAGGDPQENGGYGNGVPKGDNVGFSRITGGLANLASGLNAYRVLNSDLIALSNYLWGRSGGGFDAGGIWEKFKNYKFNPIAGIVSHHVIPASLWTGVNIGTRTGISIAGMTMDGVSNPNISGDPITGNHFGYYETGAIDLSTLPYASFADFARTKVSLYLPFCGNVSIDPSYCIGGSVNVLYQCDVLNGNIAAQVLCTDQRGCYRVVAIASGNCAYNCPYTGNDNGTGEIIGALKGVATGAISGGVGSIISGATTLGFGLEKHTTTVHGSIAGNAGWLSNMNIILTIEWGHLFDTSGYYAEMNGRPSELSGTVSDFSGHSQLIVHADAISGATEEEKREIENLCRNGVVV